MGILGCLEIVGSRKNPRAFPSDGIPMIDTCVARGGLPARSLRCHVGTYALCTLPDGIIVNHESITSKSIDLVTLDSVVDACNQAPCWR